MRLLLFGCLIACIFCFSNSFTSEKENDQIVSASSEPASSSPFTIAISPIPKKGWQLAIFSVEQKNDDSGSFIFGGEMCKLGFYDPLRDSTECRIVIGELSSIGVITWTRTYGTDASSSPHPTLRYSSFQSLESSEIIVTATKIADSERSCVMIALDSTGKIVWGYDWIISLSGLTVSPTTASDVFKEYDGYLVHLMALTFPQNDAFVMFTSLLRQDTGEIVKSERSFFNCSTKESSCEDFDFDLTDSFLVPNMSMLVFVADNPTGSLSFGYVDIGTESEGDDSTFGVISLNQIHSLIWTSRVYRTQGIVFKEEGKFAFFIKTSFWNENDFSSTNVLISVAIEIDPTAFLWDLIVFQFALNGPKSNENHFLSSTGSDFIPKKSKAGGLLLMVDHADLDGFLMFSGVFFPSNKQAYGVVMVVHDIAVSTWELSGFITVLPSWTLAYSSRSDPRKTFSFSNFGVFLNKRHKGYMYSSFQVDSHSGKVSEYNRVSISKGSPCSNTDVNITMSSSDDYFVSKFNQYSSYDPTLPQLISTRKDLLKEYKISTSDLNAGSDYVFQYSDYGCYGECASNPDVCFSFGSCEKVDQCICDPGYFGQECYVWRCFESLSNQSSQCSGHGFCDIIDHCKCYYARYSGDECDHWECFGISNKNVSVCSGHGQCVDVDKCVCDNKGYSGRECETFNCFNIPNTDPRTCSSHGTCVGVDTCECNNHYQKAPDCGEWDCFGVSNKDIGCCTGHGVCLSYDICNCSSHYSKGNCDVWSCFGIPREDPRACSGYGVCDYYDHCACHKGFFSSNCSKWSCSGVKMTDPEVCSSHGSCIGLNSCQCDRNYDIDPQNCSIWECFGINNTNKETCGGHGECADLDTCHCDEHYEESEDCSCWTCRTILRNDSLACSGRGNCTSFDSCECETDYYPSPKGTAQKDNCDGYDCFGKPHSSPAACTGRGTCQSPNHCECHRDPISESFMYTGDRCQYAFCYGVPATDTLSVCSGQGYCSDFDHCECAPGFSPPRCKVTTCFDLFYNDSKVCGGRGKCVAYDHCVCDSGTVYSGDKCDSLSQFELYLGLGIGGLMFLILVCLFFVLFVCFCLVCCICLFGIVSALVFFLCLCSCSSIGCCGWLTTRLEKARRMKFEDYLKKKKRSGLGFLQQSGFEQFGSFSFDEDDVVEEFEGDENGRGKIFGVIDGSRFVLFEGLFRDGKKEGKGVLFFPPDESVLVQRKKRSKSLRPNNDQEERPIRTRKKFEGHYSKNKRHGKGIEYSRQGKSFEGVWDEGEAVRIERGFVDLDEVPLSSFRYHYAKDKIGFGSEGDVYKVEYKGREAALKVLRRPPAGVSSLMISLHQKRNFVRSMMIGSKFHKHPNILGLFCWSGISTEELGYCMQRCEYSLADVIKDGVVGWKFKVNCLFEICLAMEYLHGLSVMHRDLKPENILIDEFEKPQICDFEFARYDDLDWRLVVSNKSVLGTPTFVAPEVIGKKHYSKKCDIFSFGIIVYCVYFDVVNPYSRIKKCDVCNLQVSPSEIVTHVVRCGMRPPLDRKEYGKDLLKLYDWLIHEVMIACTQQDPRMRPSFAKLVQLFRKKMKKKKKKKKKKMDFSDEKKPFLQNKGIN